MMYLFHIWKNRRARKNGIHTKHDTYPHSKMTMNANVSVRVMFKFIAQFLNLAPIFFVFWPPFTCFTFCNEGGVPAKVPPINISRKTADNAHKPIVCRDSSGKNFQSI